jgi:hypothetical protein
MNLTFDELATMNEAVASYIYDLKGHWRYFRNKEPGIIKEAADAEALLKRIQGELTALDPLMTFNT